MALPGDGQVIPFPLAPFRPPRNRVTEPLSVWERGGAGIQDATRGVDIYDWLIEADEETGEVWASVPDVLEPELLFVIDPLPVQLAASFDTNMQPILAWVDVEERAYFRWFDPTIPGYDIIELPAGTDEVRLALDDVRLWQLQQGATDTIFAYTYNGALYYRQLRDRFETEYLVTELGPRERLGQIGMDERLRFQFEVITDHPANGVSMRIVELDALNSSFPEWSYLHVKHSYPSLGDVHGEVLFENYAHDPRDPKAFFISPLTEDEEAEVLVTYSELPPPLESVDGELGLGDEYVNAIEDYVVYRALARDGRDVMASQARWTSFVNALGMQGHSLKRMTEMRRRPLRR